MITDCLPLGNLSPNRKRGTLNLKLEARDCCAEFTLSKGEILRPSTDSGLRMTTNEGLAMTHPPRLCEGDEVG